MRRGPCQTCLSSASRGAKREARILNGLQLLRIMSQPSARAAGVFTAGGDVTINRLGFGAMRLTGPGVWGEPQDRAECIRVLKRLPDLGVNFVDTADSYGPFVSETLIANALHPFHGMLIAT